MVHARLLVNPRQQKIVAVEIDTTGEIAEEAWDHDGFADSLAAHIEDAGFPLSSDASLRVFQVTEGGGRYLDEGMTWLAQCAFAHVGGRTHESLLNETVKSLYNNRNGAPEELKHIIRAYLELGNTNNTKASDSEKANARREPHVEKGSKLLEHEKTIKDAIKKLGKNKKEYSTEDKKVVKGSRFDPIKKMLDVRDADRHLFKGYDDIRTAASLTTGAKNSNVDVSKIKYNPADPTDPSASSDEKMVTKTIGDRLDPKKLTDLWTDLIWTFVNKNTHAAVPRTKNSKSVVGQAALKKIWEAAAHARVVTTKGGRASERSDVEIYARVCIAAVVLAEKYVKANETIK